MKASSAKPSASTFSPQEAFEFMQKMWNPLGMSLPGFSIPTTAAPPGASAAAATPAPAAMPFPNPAAFFASMDPAEIDKKIGEMRVVENWLAMSLSFVQMSIKTMELQKVSLAALSAAAAAASEPSSTPK